MINWIKKLFEDPNGVPDDARIMAVLLVLSYIVLSAWHMVIAEHHPFDPQQYGIGIGSMAAGIGVWFGVRKDN